LLVVLAILYVVVVFPVSWISTKKLQDKKLISGCLFLLTGFLIAAIGLMSIEPIIATDSFEYGERQELNKVLEGIGYGYANAMVYFCALFVSASAWGITQLQIKKNKN
jgi:hypothetical protein